MTRKFLFCFPLRAGNIVLGFIIITISTLVLSFNLYQLASNLVSFDDNEINERFRNWEKLHNIFGDKDAGLVAIVVLCYYLTYIVVSLLMLIMSSAYVCGVYKVNLCLVSAFFAYSFMHVFLSIGLVIWEATSAGWIQLGLILGFDVGLLVCLFSVKYLMEAIRTGNVYTSPGEVYYKY